MSQKKSKCDEPQKLKKIAKLKTKNVTTQNVTKLKTQKLKT